MKIHFLSQSQLLPITPDVAWAFFSNPNNLNALMPPDMAMTGESYEQPKTVFPGLIQIYRVKLAPGISTRWVSEITHVDAPNSFTDEQRFGPFAFWHHRHEIIPSSEQQVTIRDSVHYAMPFGILGEVAHALFVRPQIQRLFIHRRRMLEEFFGEE